jgi:ATP-dependent Clp protease adaptor protein ClpS
MQQFFDKTEERAYAIMLKVHIDGEGVCGIYSFDVAQTKVSQVLQKNLLFEKSYPKIRSCQKK